MTANVETKYPLQIMDGLYQLRVPIPNNPLGWVLPYLIEGRDGWTLVDSGWNVPEAFDALEQQLNDAGVGFKNLKTLLVTHIHPDHYGLAGQVKERSGATVIIHQRERDLIRSRYMNPSQLLATMGDWLTMHGVPKDAMQDLKTSAMPVRAYVDPVLPDEVVWGGERLEIGRFTFEVWWTPGHSPGHICFLERDKKFILTGDHVLPTITPNISLHPQQQGNPLGDYIASLRRLEEIDVADVLPAHEYAFKDLKARLREIEEHHTQRLDEMIQVIGRSPRTAYEVASKVKWVTGDFSSFSSWMQRAALGETIAHLDYLVLEEQLAKYMEDGIQYYKRAGND
ncbi:MAG TPA: MBL fold metallo-hydrolase [Dehalococcoidia bacterium]|nr:MBL fold metallo-hydrolase [Dehalococcoidia bacterium]